jgi:hypothetical protein
VFENRVLRRISGPKRDEVTGGWRKLHSTNGVKRNAYRIWWQSQAERNLLQDPDIDALIILQ